MFKRKQPSRTRGFSVLELLLVLVILAVLAGIVGVQFSGQSQKAKVRAAKAQLTNFKTVLSRYEMDLGQYPTTQQGLQALIEAPSGVEGWDGNYLDSDAVPQDQWGNEWQYRSPGQHNEDGYDLFSFGPDGQEGGEDDITNWTTDN